MQRRWVLAVIVGSGLLAQTPPPGTSAPGAGSRANH